MSSRAPAMIAGLCLLLLQQACAPVPQPDASEPSPVPPIMPGKPKGAWQGEYPIPKPPMPEGPAPADCPATPPDPDGESPDIPNACSAAGTDTATPEAARR